MNKNVSGALLILLVCAIIATYIIPSVKQGQEAKAALNTINAPNFDSILQQQSKEWNEGTLDAFMNYYVKSDSLLFLTGKSTLLGWQSLYDSYHNNFWVSEKKGKLDFVTSTPMQLDEKGTVYLVPGEWKITLNDTTRGGKFSLIFKYLQEKEWKIIVDHTW
jgi:ketosteroid isomerase-like protein